MGEDVIVRKKVCSKGLSSEKGSDDRQDDAPAAALDGDGIISFVMMSLNWCTLLVPKASGGTLKRDTSGPHDPGRLRAQTPKEKKLVMA